MRCNRKYVFLLIFWYTLDRKSDARVTHTLLHVRNYLESRRAFSTLIILYIILLYRCRQIAQFICKKVQYYHFDNTADEREKSAKYSELFW